MSVEMRPMTCELDSVDHYVQVFTDAAWKHRFAALSPAEHARFRAAIVAAATPLMDEDGRLRLEATSACGVGRKSEVG